MQSKSRQNNFLCRPLGFLHNLRSPHRHFIFLMGVILPIASTSDLHDVSMETTFVMWLFWGGGDPGVFARVCGNG